MRYVFKPWHAVATFSFILIAAAVVVFVGRSGAQDAKPNRSMISKILGTALSSGAYPESVEIKETEQEAFQADVEYTIDFELQESITKLIDSYKPDYGSFVAIRPETGEIINLVSYVKPGREEADELGHLALRATFPSASVFKVVTAAAALDRRMLTSESIIPFNGRSNTLYKKNVRSQKQNRWTRYMPLKEAFGRSVNTIFGKIGAYYLGYELMEHYAVRFGFNTELATDLPLQEAVADIKPDDPWNLVEAASGFTRTNLMSPVHGALIAATISNNGIMMEPYVVRKIETEEGLYYESSDQVYREAIDYLAAAEMKVLMRETVRTGTSRKSFRPFVRSRKFKHIDVGGKTGSLTGKDPFGKCDWFVGWASDGEHSIAVAALTVHEKYWTVKSSYLARKYFESYFKNIPAKSARSLAAGKNDY